MNKPYYLPILLILSSFAAVCAVLYTPALPDISQYLKITESEAQKSMSIFLIGYAVGNLPWGPIANRFGRKNSTLFGLTLAILGACLSLAIKLYPQAWLLNTGRLLTALGASVGIKIAFTYIADLYHKEHTTGKIAYLMLSFAIAPGLAIATGGILTKHYGWVSCLYATIVYGVFAFIMTFFLPETLEKQKAVPLNASNIISGYYHSLKNKSLVKSGLIMGCGTSFVYLFASLAPFIGMNLIGLKPDQYGFYNFIPPSGMVLGFYLTKLLQGRLPIHKQIKLGVAISCVFVCLMLVIFLIGYINPLTLFLPMPGIYTGLSLVFSSASSLALASSENKSNASAVMNFLNLGLCVVVLFISEVLPIKSSLLLPSVYTFVVLMMIGLYRTLQNSQKHA